MRVAGKYLFLLGLIVTPPIAAAAGYGEQVGEIYRAPNLNGVTGLLIMDLPYTMGGGITVAGGGSYAGTLTTPTAPTGGYKSLTTVVAAARIGFTDNFEIGVSSKSYTMEPSTGTSEIGVGDTEGMIKWKFRNQNENLPAMALGFGVIAPTGDETKGFTNAKNGGAKLSVTAGAELPVFEDGYLGLYGEAIAVAIDKLGGTTPYTDMYGVINLGVAIPISDDNHLSFFVEYNKLVKKDTLFGMESNHTIISPGLRLAYNNFSLAVAGHNISYDNLPGVSQRRIMGLVSLGF